MIPTRISRSQPIYRGPLQGIVFDWAGTTLDFGSRAPVQAVCEAFAAMRVPISQAQAREPMGMAKRDHLRAILRMEEVRQEWRRVYGREPEDRDVDTLYSGFVPIQRKHLAECSQLIPGCLEAIADCRARGMRIGSSTGYVRELMDVLVPLAAAQGYVPDAVVCASDVSPGRPAPWMCLENARLLGLYPMQSLVAVDDTTVGILAGLHAGMWTIGVAASGNEVGLSLEELKALEPADRSERIERAREKLRRCGAHWVIETVAELPSVLDEISLAIGQGERP